MASRFPSRDSARNNLFSGYDARKASSRPTSTSPAPGANGGRPSYSHAYNNAASNSHPPSGRTSSEQLGGQPQYNQAMLEQLESQNDGGLSEMSKKVSMLKDITIKIGDEIRDSTHMAEKMNDTFGATGVRLKGTMNRMLRMAERTGVGWRVWVGFFAFVICIFWYVRFLR